MPPSQYPIAADTYHNHHHSHSHHPHSYSSQSAASSSYQPRNNENPSNGHNILHRPKAEETHPQAYSAPGGDSFSTYPLYNWSYKQHQLLPVPVPTTVPPLSYYYRPRRLEEIAPRDTISLIIALFFDFVYPLTPCVHKPSFMADLHARREERDPLFFALVMSTIASTLVQVPRSYLPMERPVVRKLAQTAHEASRHITIASYDPPTSMHVVIRYLYVINALWHPRYSHLFLATASITFVRATMQHSTLPSARLPTSPSLSACTKKPATTASTPLNVKSAEEFSGSYLEVCIPFHLSDVLFAVAISVCIVLLPSALRVMICQSLYREQRWAL